MKDRFQNWEQSYPDYWVKKKTNWFVRNNNTEEEELWRILDNQRMMFSCESGDN